MNVHAREIDEEYLDDPIKLADIEQQRLKVSKLNLIDINSVVFRRTSNTNINKQATEEEQISAYGRKSFELPVTFFDNTKNIRLLNNCCPLSINIVDCDKYPWYYSKYFKYEDTNVNSNDSHDTIISMSSTPIHSDINEHIILLDEEMTSMLPSNKPMEELAEGKNICKSNTYNKQEDIGDTKNNKTGDVPAFEINLVQTDVSKIDFKRNKGLIGLKIQHKIFVDDSERKNIDNVEIKEKVSPTAENIKLSNNQRKENLNINAISTKVKQKEMKKTQNENKNVIIIKKNTSNGDYLHTNNNAEHVKAVSSSLKSLKKCCTIDQSVYELNTNIKTNKDTQPNLSNDVEKGLRLIFGLSDSTNHSFKSVNSIHRNNSVSGNMYDNNSKKNVSFSEQQHNSNITDYNGRTSLSNKSIKSSETCKEYSQTNSKYGSSSPIFPCNVNKNKSLNQAVPKFNYSDNNKTHHATQINKTECGNKSQVKNCANTNIGYADNVQPKFKHVRRKNNETSTKINKKIARKDVAQTVNNPTENNNFTSHKVNDEKLNNVSTHAVINISSRVVTNVADQVSQNCNNILVLPNKLGVTKESNIKKNITPALRTNDPRINDPVSHKERNHNGNAAQSCQKIMPLAPNSQQPRNNMINNKASNFCFQSKRPTKKTLIRPYISQSQLHERTCSASNIGHQIPTLIHHRSEPQKIGDTMRHTSRQIHNNTNNSMQIHHKAPNPNYMPQSAVEYTPSNFAYGINMGADVLNRNLFWSHLTTRYPPHPHPMPVTAQHLPQVPPMQTVATQMPRVLSVPPIAQLPTKEIQTEKSSQNALLLPSNPIKYSPGNSKVSLISPVVKQSNSVNQRVNIIAVPISATTSQPTDNLNNAVIKTEPKINYIDAPITSKKEMLEELTKITEEEIIDDENISSTVSENCTIFKAQTPIQVTNSKSNYKTLTSDQTNIAKAIKPEIGPHSNANKDTLSTESKRYASTNKASKEAILKSRTEPLSKSCATPSVKNQADRYDTPPPRIVRLSKGYSPPILPIPTYQKTLEILTNNNYLPRKPIKREYCAEIPEEKNKVWKFAKKSFGLNYTEKGEALKKISINDYMERTKNSEGFDREEPRKKIPRKHSHSAHAWKSKKFKYGDIFNENNNRDLGYDSDTTVVL